MGKTKAKGGTKAAPEDFFIGNASTSMVKDALRDHKPFILPPDYVLSFNDGEKFGVNAAAVAAHIKGDILLNICSPGLKRQAREDGEMEFFDFNDYLQQNGNMNSEGKVEISENSFLMFTAEKIDALVLYELLNVAHSEALNKKLVVNRLGSDEDDWD